MHHNDIGVRLREPARQLFVGHYARCQISPVAFVVAVVLEAASLTCKRPNELCVSDAVGLQLAPEQSTPAPLVDWLTMIDGVLSFDLRESRTGLPVIESPNGMMRTVASSLATTDVTPVAAAITQSSIHLENIV